MPRLKEANTVYVGKDTLLNLFAEKSQYTKADNEGNHPCFTCGKNHQPPEKFDIICTGKNNDIYLFICQQCLTLMSKIEDDTMDILTYMRHIRTKNQFNFPGEL